MIRAHGDATRDGGVRLASQAEMLRTLSAVVLLVVAIAPRTAHAQTDGKFAVGANLGVRDALSPDADGGVGIGLLWRIGHSRTGWGWHWGFSWVSTDVAGSIDGAATELGELHVRPVMVGYGYTRVFGRTAVTGQVIGGYALSTLELAPEARAAFRDRLGAESVTVRPSGHPAFKPEVHVWRDLNGKVGLRVSAGYLVARPQITIRSTIGEDRRQLRADMLMLTVGMVYSIF
jgi:hypothetical protein